MTTRRATGEDAHARIPDAQFVARVCRDEAGSAVFETSEEAVGEMETVDARVLSVVMEDNVLRMKLDNGARLRSLSRTREEPRIRELGRARATL